jgi:hypothetical protein
MIPDGGGHQVDDARVLHCLVTAHDRGFPGGNDPDDRLGHLLAAVGGVTNAVLTTEQGWPFAGEGVDPRAALTEALVDVLRAAGGIAVHYRLPVRLPPSTGYLISPDSFVQLALLVQAAGALAQAVHVVEQPAPRSSATSFGSTWASTFDSLSGRPHDSAVAPELPDAAPRTSLARAVADDLGRAVDLVILRALVLAEHYGLRETLRAELERCHRTLHHEGIRQ